LTAFVGYAVVIWAMTQAPIAMVAALRETSVVFAALLGVTLLGGAGNRLHRPAVQGVARALPLSQRPAAPKVRATPGGTIRVSMGHLAPAPRARYWFNEKRRVLSWAPIGENFFSNIVDL
jgi:hypothetical protein